MGYHLFAPKNPLFEIRKTSLGSYAGIILPDRPYWVVELDNGRMYSELDRVETGKLFDWTIDLVATGDVRRVQALRMYCPPDRHGLHPEGQACRISSAEKGTLFQLKLGMSIVRVVRPRVFQSQIIGRVDDKVSGACSCFVWDAYHGLLFQWTSNVYAMGTWRDGIAPIGAIDLHQMGIVI